MYKERKSSRQKYVNLYSPLAKICKIYVNLQQDMQISMVLCLRNANFYNSKAKICKCLEPYIKDM